jgi:flavorubredoxin
MKPLEIKSNIFWVGGIDWNLRNFHGYLTQRGSTYNAYLILDEKVVLVDTVKSFLFEEMLSRIKEVVDPARIDYVVANHAEMDHSGSLPKILKIASKAKVITSPHGEKGLRRHFKEEWDFHVVKSGDSINIGKRTLQFFLTPMVHWPDSMATYVPEEKILLPNDAFGQHIATVERFDDEVGWDIVYRQATKYYATIVLPYGEQVKKALEALSGLKIDMIAPSHGVIWRSHLSKILEAYQKWADNQSENKALIVYDTMWGSTEKIAYALRDGIERSGIPVTMRNLSTNHISDIMTDVLPSRAILIGSPTLNNGVLPTIGAFLTFLEGLRPKKRIGFAFGSYGWGGQGVKKIEALFENLKWEMPLEGINFQYVPDEEELEKAVKTGEEFGNFLKKGDKQCQV